MKRFLTAVFAFVILFSCFMPSVLAEPQRPDGVPQGTPLYLVTLVALVEPDFESQCNSIVAEFQNTQNFIDIYEFHLEKYNGWTAIIMLPEGDYILTGVSMPRSLVSLFPRQTGVEFHVGDAQNMVVTFTIGDPSKVPQMTELPAAVIDEPTAQPADEPTVQPTEAPADNTAAAADEPTALPVSGTAETPSGEAVRKTSPVLIAILIAAGVGIVAFTALKLIKRRK